MQLNLLTLLITVLFIIIGIIQLAYSIRLKKLYPKKHNINTSIATFILYVLAGILYPILYPSKDLVIQAISTITIAFITPLIIISTLALEYIKTKNNRELREKRDFSNFLREFFNNQEKTSILAWDLKRKLFHLIPGIIILIILLLNIENIELILTIGYSGVLLFASLDLVRFSYVFTQKNLHYLLPHKITKVLSRFMKERELYEPIKPAPLILGMIPSLFFPISIFFSIALIATISDAAASIVGHAIGKTHFPKMSKKTLEGYAAGALSAFIIVLLSCLTLSPAWPLNKIITLSLTGTLTFFIIDLANTKIDDNVLNPLITGIVLGITYLIIF